MKFKRALVREPSNTFPRCISSHPAHDSVSITRAKKQHKNYCQVIASLGLEVIKLEPNNAFPDGCFVEDTAIVHKNRAIISRMGALSRRGEERAVYDYLSEYLDTKIMATPGTIEGGDVLHHPSYLISGVSQRTNQEGIQQLSDWLQVKVKQVKDDTIIHLKSHVTYLDRKTIVVDQKVADHPVFTQYAKVLIPEKEQYVTNTLTINKTVLLPSGFPESKNLIFERGFEVITLNMSEYQKCEGALTCLSILF